MLSLIHKAKLKSNEIIDLKQTKKKNETELDCQDKDGTCQILNMGTNQVDFQLTS